MAIAICRVECPLYFSAGQRLNGVELDSHQWVRDGVIEIDYDRAVAEAKNGYGKIISVDGAEYSASACCSGH